MLTELVATTAALWLGLVLLEFLFYRPFRRPSHRAKSLGSVKFSRDKLPERVDAVVIGAGQGGLSCASVLAQYGYRVVVFEQHEVIGGGAHTFAVDGKTRWRFDAGLHFTIPWHEQALQLAVGAAAPPVPVPKLGEASGVYERISLGGAAPLEVKDEKQLEGDLAARFPEHAAAIRSYFRLAESVQLRFALWVVSSVLPMGARLALLASPLMRMWRKWASKTTRDGLNELIPGDDARTAQLRALMSGLWLDSGSPPTRMSFWMQTAVFGGFQVLGAAYPTGGPQEMAMAMAEAVEARGGAVFVKTPVASIEVDGSGAAVGVRLADGDLVRAPLVVSGLGYRSTESLLPAAHRAGRKLQTDQSCGFVMANIALDGTADELGISSANLWLQPASEANDWDVFGGIDAFFESPLDVPVAHIPAGITFPSVKDRSHAGARQQPSHHSCQILVPACFEWFSALEEESGRGDGRPEPLVGSRHAPPHVFRSEAYAESKAKWKRRLLELLHTHYPKPEGKVAFCDISTPVTIENYLRQGDGAAIGLDVTPGRFVDANEVRQLDMRSRKVRGLWLAGQDSLMCGQVIAAGAGIVCALRILGPVAMIRFAIRAVRLLAPRAVAALLRKPDAPPSVDPLSAIPLARKSDPMSAIPLASPRDRDSLPPPPSVSPTPDDG